MKTNRVDCEECDGEGRVDGKRCKVCHGAGSGRSDWGEELAEWRRILAKHEVLVSDDGTTAHLRKPSENGEGKSYLSTGGWIDVTFVAGGRVLVHGDFDPVLLYDGGGCRGIEGLARWMASFVRDTSYGSEKMSLAMRGWMEDSFDLSLAKRDAIETLLEWRDDESEEGEPERDCYSREAMRDMRREILDSEAIEDIYHVLYARGFDPSGCHFGAVGLRGGLSMVAVVGEVMQKHFESIKKEQ